MIGGCRLQPWALDRRTLLGDERVGEVKGYKGGYNTSCARHACSVGYNHGHSGHGLHTRSSGHPGGRGARSGRNGGAGLGSHGLRHHLPRRPLRHSCHWTSLRGHGAHRWCAHRGPSPTQVKNTKVLYYNYYDGSVKHKPDSS